MVVHYLQPVVGHFLKKVCDASVSGGYANILFRKARAAGAAAAASAGGGSTAVQPRFSGSTAPLPSSTGLNRVKPLREVPDPNEHVGYYLIRNNCLVIITCSTAASKVPWSCWERATWAWPWCSCRCYGAWKGPYGSATRSARTTSCNGCLQPDLQQNNFPGIRFIRHVVSLAGEECIYLVRGYSFLFPRNVSSFTIAPPTSRNSGFFSRGSAVEACMTTTPWRSSSYLHVHFTMPSSKWT